MKKFLAIIALSLFFFSFSKTDDIKDFQLEGIGIGNSALEFFSKNEIEDKKKFGFIYKEKNYYSVTFHKKSFFETYDSVQLHLKKDDAKYKIYSVGGQKDYGQNRINECYQDQIKAYKEIKNFFKSVKAVEEKAIPWSNDKNSTVKSSYISLRSGDEIAIQCYDHPEESEFNDTLVIAIDSEEFVKWLYKKF